MGGWLILHLQAAPRFPSYNTKVYENQGCHITDETEVHFQEDFMFFNKQSPDGVAGWLMQLDL